MREIWYTQVVIWRNGLGFPIFDRNLILNLSLNCFYLARCQIVTVKSFQTTLHKKLRFFIKDFCSNCDRFNSFLRIWSHLLKKSLMKNIIFCAVPIFPFSSPCNGLTIAITIQWFCRIGKEKGKIQLLLKTRERKIKILKQCTTKTSNKLVLFGFFLFRKNSPVLHRKQSRTLDLKMKSYCYRMKFWAQICS